ncbi:hypothetical protein [Streptomyces sp. NPDC048603]|uniref:hypothetical protein n=1 Tax=Streptomyces sp. NPDC048603 TaxID=3365577 RepID=UPI00371E6080
MPKFKRVASVMAAMAMAVALPVLTALPAAADQGDCQYYLHTKGYRIGPKVEAACSVGVQDWKRPQGYAQCLFGLTNIGVKREHAVVACQEAA